MKWPKGTTCWPAFAGTSDTLSETLPKAVTKLRSSLTISTSCWTFSTLEAATRMLEERKMMAMASSTMPLTRVHLWVQLLKWEEARVWEVVDKLPPSTAPELEPDNVGPPRLPQTGFAFPSVGEANNGTLAQELEPELEQA